MTAFVRLMRPLWHLLLRTRVVIDQRVRWFRDEVDVARGTYVAKGATLGKRVRINGPSHIDECHIGPYSVTGRIAIRSSNHHTQFLNMQESAQRRVIGGMSVLKPPHAPVRIGAGCWLGDNVTILEGVEIGDGAVVGAGSVVTKSVPAYAIAAGNPAAVLRYRFPDRVIHIIKDLKWWTWDDATLTANRDLFETDLNAVDPDELARRVKQLR